MTLQVTGSSSSLTLTLLSSSGLSLDTGPEEYTHFHQSLLKTGGQEGESETCTEVSKAWSRPVLPKPPQWMHIRHQPPEFECFGLRNRFRVSFMFRFKYIKVFGQSLIKLGSLWITINQISLVCLSFYQLPKIVWNLKYSLPSSAWTPYNTRKDPRWF